MGSPKIGFFPGSWDLLHNGHVRALKEAAHHCDFLVVGLQSDPSIDRPEKNKPILTLDERIELLQSNVYVDSIWTYTTEKELHQYDAIAPYDIRFMGADHKGKKHPHVKKKIVYVSRNHGYSSTALRERIKNG